MNIFEIFDFLGFDLTGLRIFGTLMMLLGITILWELGSGFSIFSNYGGRFHIIINIICIFLIVIGFLILFFKEQV